MRLVLIPDVKGSERHVIRLSFGCRTHHEELVCAILALQSSLQQFDLFHCANHAI